MSDTPRKLAAEALGTCLLVATVIGSGIMADRLSDDGAVTLLANTLPTGAMLVVLITMLAPVSGAHFNPAVSLVLALRRQLGWRLLLPYVLAQVAGGIAGAVLANLMFDLPALQMSTAARAGTGIWLSEAVATFTLIGAILLTARFRPDFVPVAVGLTITGAYWFTTSTSFANPAVALARAFSDTYAGISLASVPLFILAELAGAGVALVVFGWLIGGELPAMSEGRK